MASAAIRFGRRVDSVVSLSIAHKATAWARIVPLLFGCGILASCREGVLDPHGPVGQAERVILYDATTIMLAVVVPVIILTLAFAWWFRAGNRRATYRPDWEYPGTIELIVWAIPALVILFLGGIAWIGSHELDPPKPLASAASPLEVEVVSLDWRWLFIYPRERIATVNRLVVPTGVPVHFRLTSTQRHEQLLYSPTRQPDLHHGRDDDAAQSAGGSSRHLPGDLRAVQRTWIL